MAAVRGGFQRYLLSLQYHGSSFLGFSYQGEQHRTVEGCVRQALQSLAGTTWENLQVSSRTDRGVHALKNTFHVDLRHQKWTCEQIHRGLNFYLQRLHEREEGKRRLLRERIDRDVRILRVMEAPQQMPNPWAQQDPTQPLLVDWNARFSATQRTYVYRIIHSHDGDLDWMVPFEWDRAWRIHSQNPLNIEAMQQAADMLVGEHDFSSFRGKGCQRISPIVNLSAVRVNARDLNDFEPLLWGTTIDKSSRCQLITIQFEGNSFVYRQVRNLTGCLVQVGKGRLRPHDIPSLMAARNRALAPGMAPPHGLFLVDVQHQGIRI
ncbi:tRNA pseudouridine38-40 synthase [Fistulifera solaris]|uniref:tRNA pseudouridine synthase n=1 Tax=Fistulifera solaris TaxID=1519565 RepID=A0A1Z5JBV7_FISSO|nr:tRNA pseudouridine38-40 synthase [Fistulifera solaris]|eukprot:GAX11372.1 tRNA pseudouridine38-40 synthase [Fistulifera solaris]